MPIRLVIADDHPLVLDGLERLFQADLKDLEFASTIVYFHKQGHDWLTAVAKMCQFKGLTNGNQVVERADALAREITGSFQIS